MEKQKRSALARTFSLFCRRNRLKMPPTRQKSRSQMPGALHLPAAGRVGTPLTPTKSYTYAIDNKTKGLCNRFGIICLPDTPAPDQPICPLDSYAWRKMAKNRGATTLNQPAILAAPSPGSWEAGQCEASAFHEPSPAHSPGSQRQSGCPVSRQLGGGRLRSIRFSSDTANPRGIISIRIHNKTKARDNHSRIICLPDTPAPAQPICPLDSYAWRKTAKPRGYPQTLRLN
jgi:hypothetical protein